MLILRCMPNRPVSYTTHETACGTAYLGALKVDVIDKGHAVTSAGDLISYIQVLEAERIMLGLGCFSMRAHDKGYSSTAQVTLVRVAVEAVKLVAVR